MLNTRINNNCAHNLLYVRFNEDFGRANFFSFDMQYPSFFNIAGQQNAGNPGVLRNINSALQKSAEDFKKGIYEEAKSYNNAAINNSQTPKVFTSTSTYAMTFSMNNVLSCILDLQGGSPSTGIYYNTLNNYNINLNTGRELTLSDVFNTNTDYISLITSYITEEISKHPEWYYPIEDLEIPDSQSFYLTFDGVVVYFGLDEIAPAEFGIPKFKINYGYYGQYINPLLFCAF